MDDYLANRTSDADKVSFEKKLDADPALKSEFNSQQSVIEGIKKARVAELKNIMNNTPIPPAAGTSAIVTKVAAWVITLGIVGFGVYWFSQEEDQPTKEVTEEINPVLPQENEVEVVENQQTPVAEPVETEAETLTKKEEKSKVNKPKTAKKPELEVYDPTNEAREDQITDAIDPIIPGAKQKVSTLIVVTDSTQKKYDFHYQFRDGKLVLMGSFDATLYEILEFFTDDKRTMFLYYTGEYYLLDESKTKPTPLTSITDQQLLKKLEMYRAN